MKLSLDHVSLHILNMPACAAFYTDVLGLTEIAPRVALPGVRWFQLAGGATIHLIPGALHDDGLTFGDHFAMATPDLETVMNELRDKHIPFGKSSDANGQASVGIDGVRRIFLRDPDNNLVEINNQPS